MALILLTQRQHFYAALDWFSEHRLEGAVSYAAFIVVAIALVCPGSLLWAGAGFAFHPLYYGFLVAWIGSAVGLTCAFLIGRFFLRAWVKEMVAERRDLMAVDRVLKQRGMRVVLALRLALFPFNMGNYMFSGMSVTFRDYVVASVVGIAPSVVLFAYFGSVAHNIHELATNTAEDHTTAIMIALLAGAVIITVFVLILRAAKKVLKVEHIADSDIEDEPQQQDYVHDHDHDQDQEAV